VCFAHKGSKVIGVDVDPQKIKEINEGKSPIYEPRLDELLKASINSKALCCTNDYEYATRNSEISFITVGTPSRANGALSLRHLKSAVKNIGKSLRTKRDYHLVVVKSTVLPGTTENIVKPLMEEFSGKKCGSTFDICCNPEFLRQGSAIEDVLNPDRIIIGEFGKKSGNSLEHLYREFYGRKHPPIIRSSPSTAELIKCANNAFLAIKISFANTIASICEAIPGADVTVVSKAIGLDRRIGSLFLNAGLGYGGSCLPKDLRGLAYVSKRLRLSPLLLRAVEKVNNLQPLRVVEMAQTLLGNLQGKRVAILGLAFKPNTDDVRDSASMRVAKRFVDERAEVIVYDPMAMKNARNLLNNKVQYASSPIECINGADCCVIATEWPEFKTLKSEDFICHMRTPVLIDARRIYSADMFRSKLRFSAIGLGKEHK
jgi:UDPglucose 6-dehydrogenase